MFYSLFCAAEIPYAYKLMEKKYEIPVGLLYAIALTESGRTLNSQRVAWPWTLNIQGKGFYFEDKESMQAKLLEQLSQTELIDIGPMQINWRWQKHRVSDPLIYTQLWKNLEVGACVLKEAFNQNQDWFRAIGAYHSPKKSRANNYAHKVMKAWSNL